MGNIEEILKKERWRKKNIQKIKKERAFKTKLTREALRRLAFN